jgi:acetyltransferase
VSGALVPVEHVPAHVFEGRDHGYVVRLARLSDEARLRQMFERAAPQDISYRFFRYVRTFPHALVEPLMRTDEHRHFAFVAHPVGARHELVASAMLAAEPGGAGAEFGIFVDAAHRGRRLGKHLLDCLFREARAHGIARVYGLILADNADMLGLARYHGFTLAPDPHDAGCVRAEAPVPA